MGGWIRCRWRLLASLYSKRVYLSLAIDEDACFSNFNDGKGHKDSAAPHGTGGESE